MPMQWHRPVLSLYQTCQLLSKLLCPAHHLLQAAAADNMRLQEQLARCTPAEFDRLHNELLLAKRAAGQVPGLQRQLEEVTALWQAAEGKLADVQVCLGRSVCGKASTVCTATVAWHDAHSRDPMIAHQHIMAASGAHRATT